MTGNLLIDSLISIGAIAVMVLTARLVFPAPPAKVTREAAQKRLAFDEPDFDPIAWLEDTQGRAVIAANQAGEFALVSRLGLDLVVRRFKAGAVQAEIEGGALVLRLPDPTVPRAVIEHRDAAIWARNLAGDSDITGS